MNHPAASFGLDAESHSIFDWIPDRAGGVMITNKRCKCFCHPELDSGSRMKNVL